MSQKLQAFTYDDFERYLLDTAQLDEAPPDLSNRICTALGVGLPALAAAELSSLVPTTTSVAGASQIATQGGFFATAKSALSAGASTLFGTAAKGAAVGLISGVALIGSVRAVSKMTRDDESGPQTVAAVAAAQRPVRVQSPVATRGAADVRAELNPSGDEGSVADDSPADEPAATTTRPPRLANFGVATGFEPATESAAELEDKRPRTRLPRPIFPEKTTAIARYPLLYDDVSAFYDAPKDAKKPAPASAKPSDVVLAIDPAALSSMRSKAIQRSRDLLGQSRAAAALAELDEFRHRVGEHNFGVDELLLRIEALAVLGRAKEAQADVKNVERLAPNSAALRQAQALARSRFVR